MSKELVVLQGKMFYVELQSMLGSTNYGWCLKSMPAELVLVGIQNIPTGTRIAPTIQRYYFAAVSSENINVQVIFTLASMSDFSETADEFKADIRIIPSDSEDFVPYSENGVNPELMYGITYSGKDVPEGDNNAAFKYGYPCTMADTPFIHRYSRGTNDTPFIRRYPCSANDASLKYGYPCGVNDAGLKYGYPCGVNDASLKYGYPCGVNDASLKYGYPCGVNDASLKYGYPCGVNDASLKYGYPCADYAMDSRPYGMVYTGQEARLYAFPMDR